MSELKPCPFCGDTNPTHYPGIDYWPKVQCDNCGINTSHTEGAVETWNGPRAMPPAIRAVCEEMRAEAKPVVLKGASDEDEASRFVREKLNTVSQRVADMMADWLKRIEEAYE